MPDPITTPPDPQAAAGLEWATVLDVLDTLEKQGYHRGDDAHVGRAIGLLGQLVKVYTGADE